MKNWSEEPPSVEGPFWVKPKYGPAEVVNVVFDDAFNRLGAQVFGESFIWALDRFGGALWFGPIEPPAVDDGLNG